VEEDEDEDGYIGVTDEVFFLTDCDKKVTNELTIGRDYLFLPKSAKMILPKSAKMKD